MTTAIGLVILFGLLSMLGLRPPGLRVVLGVAFALAAADRVSAGHVQTFAGPLVLLGIIAFALWILVGRPGERRRDRR